MVRLGRVDVNDRIACLIRQAALDIGGYDWIIAGIVSAESGFDPNAVGDAGRSIGLLQLYVDGGQGSAYRDNPDALKDPKLNLSIGVPPIAIATLQATQRGYSGERFIREVARSSGHPGWVPLDDARLTHIYNDTVELITDRNGNLVPWPPHNPAACAGAPPPPPPLGSWSEGPTPATAAQADAAIHRHLERMSELVDKF
jgi:hypothetical protein